MNAVGIVASALITLVVMSWCACDTGRQGPGASAPSLAPSARPVDAATLSKRGQAAAQIHEQVAAEVLAGLRDHDFDAVERHFDAPMQREVPKEKVSRVWSRTVAAMGELTSWALVERDNPEGYDRLRFRLHHEQGTWEAVITFPPEGNDVAGLLIRPPSTTSAP
jgi:hypothetical protein